MKEKEAVVAVDKIWFNEKEAINYTGFGRTELFLNRDKGKLSYRTYGKRKIIYSRSDLDKFIENNTHLVLSVDEQLKNIMTKRKKIL